MNPKLTDDAVADLPLHHGRAELLEEIMRSPALDDRPVAAPETRRRHSWLAPVAAAATVAALAAGSAWWASSGGPDPESTPVAGGGAQAGAPAGPDGAYRAVLEADGWTLESAYTDPTYETGEIGYAQGDRTLEIDWYPASDYDSRYDDRRHITDPPSDGTPVDVLGLRGSMWAYSADDHTVIRPVEHGHYLEVRGSGMDQQEYVALLRELRLVDADGFDAALPDGFVSNAERSSQIDAILDGIEAKAGTLLPAGVPRASITSDQSDPYQLGAEVTGQVACAWVGQFAEAKRTGDEFALQEAVGVMETAYRWPVLDEMNDRGDWPEWIWSMVDDMDAGRVPPGWQQSCQP
ncbi:hypothetical protein [Nocardioides sp.]|uniref:hypothetical protein n=1 Tax=Nocardioides sp. TaxID=35761 RepID=UPI0037837226